MNVLTERQLLILQVIVDDFVRSAQPVGSRALSKKEQLSFSSATIRNEMADLEELGLIEKTHTSSGRVPSEKGYRYYVDHLLSPGSLDPLDVKKVRSVFDDHIYETEQVIQKSASILSDLTSYTSIVLGPALKKHKFRSLQLVPLTENTAVAMIVTDTGHVEHHTVTIPSTLNWENLEVMVRLFNDKLRNIPLHQLKDYMYKELALFLKNQINQFETIIDRLTYSMEDSAPKKVFFGGKTNILSQPEFHDIQKLRSIMELMEKEEGILQLFKETPSGIHVKIGKEMGVHEMDDCSIITASYSIGQVPVGSIAILGPTRMEYSRVISLLDLFTNDLSKALTNFHQK